MQSLNDSSCVHTIDEYKVKLINVKGMEKS